MIKNHGFTLIELIIFVIILSILSATILTATVFALRHSPIAHNQTISTTAASGCMEYLLGQRLLNGFNFNGQPCPGGNDDLAVPSFCSNIAPNGFTTLVKISCSPKSLGGINEFKLITVRTMGPGSGMAIFNSLIADY